MIFDHKAKTMNIKCLMSVDPTKSFQEANDVKNLSGGERSAVTFNLLLALGHVIESPFRIMDEYDVFMDEILRKKTVDELQKHTARPQFAGRQL